MGRVVHTGGTPHLLELCLSPPRIKLPSGRGGQPCTLFAQVGVLGDGGDKAQHPEWDEPVTIALPSSQSVVVISLYLAEPGSHSLDEAHGRGEARFFADLCLPYAGLAQLGICADGPPGLLRLALVPGTQYGQESLDDTAGALQRSLEQFQPDRPWVAVSVRELSAPTEWAGPDVEWTLPFPKKEILMLELENAALQTRLCEILPHAVRPTPEELSTLPDHMRQLQSVQVENEQLRQEKADLLQKLENTRAVMSGVPGTERTLAEQDRSKTYRVLQRELGHCREREQKIRASYEERLGRLQGQLQHAHDEVGAHLESERAAGLLSQEVAAMEEHLNQAAARQRALQQQLQTAQEATDLAASRDPDAPSPDPDVRRLQAESEDQKAELAALRREAAALSQQDSEGGEPGHAGDGHGAAREQELRGKVKQLSDELEELQRAREDERVRSESEVREMRSDRDSIKDRLDDAAAELQRLGAEAEALQDLQAQARLREEEAFAAAPAPANDDDIEEQERELERLRGCAEDRRCTIREIEREQEALVEKTASVATPQAAAPDTAMELQDAKEKAVELQQQFVRARCSCEVQRAELARLMESTEAAKARAQALRQSYDAFQQSSDERVLRSPEPVRYATGGR